VSFEVGDRVQNPMGRQGVIKREISGQESGHFHYCIECDDGSSWWTTRHSIRELSLLQQLADTAVDSGPDREPLAHD
jgi:hypothetical protein